MFLFFNATTTSEFYSLSLHDALPICDVVLRALLFGIGENPRGLVELDKLAEIHKGGEVGRARRLLHRSEEHTSELQSRRDLVCRLLLEKKKLVIITDFCVIL